MPGAAGAEGIPNPIDPTSGEGNLLAEPDYQINDPWDFWPLPHSQDDHLFPFG